MSLLSSNLTEPADRAAKSVSSSGQVRSLDGQVALVTGGAVGIGRACAARFLGQGARVAIVDRDAAAGTAALEGLDTKSVVFQHCDVGRPDAVEAAFAAVHRDWGRLDILVTCAGGFFDAPPLEAVDPHAWTEVVSNNLTTAYLSCRAAITRMRPAGYGRIVNVASMAARTALPDVAHAYAAAKSGVVGLTRQLALEVAADGVTVNAVAPGVVLSPRVERLHAGRLAELTAATPVGRLGTPEDVAGAISYLASPGAGYITGVTLDVNGGRFIG